MQGMGGKVARDRWLSCKGWVAKLVACTLLLRYHFGSNTDIPQNSQKKSLPLSAKCGMFIHFFLSAFSNTVSFVQIDKLLLFVCNK